MKRMKSFKDELLLGSYFKSILMRTEQQGKKLLMVVIACMIIFLSSDWNGPLPVS